VACEEDAARWPAATQWPPWVSLQATGQVACISRVISANRVTVLGSMPVELVSGLLAVDVVHAPVSLRW
jgi:hypothetical protein